MRRSFVYLLHSTSAGEDAQLYVGCGGRGDPLKTKSLRVKSSARWTEAHINHRELVMRRCKS